MSLQETKTEVQLNNLSQLIDNIDEDQLRIISDLVLKRQAKEHKNKIDPLPDLANNEYKIFDDREVEKITDKILEIRRRRYIAFVFYYSNFDRTDDQMVQFIRFCTQPPLSYVQAMRDLNKIKGLIGNMHRVRKELIRYQVIEMHKRAYQTAEKNNDPKAMTAAANGISVAANLDKDDQEIPWDQMLPPLWEPTEDISALGEGFEKRQNLETDIARLKKKYGDIEDIQEE